MQSIAAAVVAVVHAPVGVVKMPKFYRQNKKRIDPRYFLNEGSVNLNGYTAWTEDWNDCTVLLDDMEVSIPQIFDELNTGHEEWRGWKENIPEGSPRDDFMSEQISAAVEDWCDMHGHRLEKPDFY